MDSTSIQSVQPEPTRSAAGTEKIKFWQILILIVFIAAIGTAIAVWQPWRATTKTIQTSGTGKVKGVPDVSKIQGSVEVKRATADKAQTDASSTMSKIIDAAKAKGIAEKDIKTDTISVNPSYNYADGKSTLDGYFGRAGITVTVRDVAKSQEIVDLMTANGANNLYGPNLTFSDEKLEELRNQAQAAAVIKARESAENLAKAGKTKVGKVVTISDASYPSIPSYPYRELMTTTTDAAGKATTNAITPGESEITATVTVTFGLK